jgi:hypothetical protein
MTATEAQVEAQTCELFARHGWLSVKTDAGEVRRGGRPGNLPTGFPDVLFLLSLPGCALSLCALVEMKTHRGRVRDSQHAYHAQLRTVYGLSPQIVRTPEEALKLIDEGRRIRSALRVGL